MLLSKQEVEIPRRRDRRGIKSEGAKRGAECGGECVVVERAGERVIYADEEEAFEVGTGGGDELEEVAGIMSAVEAEMAKTVAWLSGDLIPLRKEWSNLEHAGGKETTD